MTKFETTANFTNHVDTADTLRAAQLRAERWALEMIAILGEKVIGRTFEIYEVKAGKRVRRVDFYKLDAVEVARLQKLAAERARKAENSRRCRAGLSAKKAA